MISAAARSADNGRSVRLGLDTATDPPHAHYRGRSTTGERRRELREFFRLSPATNLKDSVKPIGAYPCPDPTPAVPAAACWQYD